MTDETTQTGSPDVTVEVPTGSPDTLVTGSENTTTEESITGSIDEQPASTGSEPPTTPIQTPPQEEPGADTTEVAQAQQEIAEAITTPPQQEPSAPVTPQPAEQQPVDEKPLTVQTSYENLTEDQKADLLVYGETYTDEHGRRVSPETVVKSPDGKVYYSTIPDY